MHYWIPFICQKKLWKTLKWAKILLGVLCSGLFWIFCTLQSFRYFTNPSCKKTGSNVKRFSPSDSFSLGKYNVLPRRIYLNGPYIHVPMQCCSLWHQILLSPPDTSTTEHRFLFGPATSFFLGLLVAVLHSSPVANWTPSELGQSSFDVISFCLFIQFMRFSWQVYWGGLPYCHMVCTYYNYLVLCGFPFPSINSISWWTEIMHTYHIPPSSQQTNLPLLLGQQKPPDR